VKAWLFTDKSGGQAVSITPYWLANPSYANYPAAIRMAYGSAQGCGLSSRTTSEEEFARRYRKLAFLPNVLKIFSVYRLNKL
jgi:hypothetical protein